MSFGAIDIVFITSSMKGNGYGSFFVVAFNFLKSIQILNLPFFLGTTTVNDNHVDFFYRFNESNC